ncbi:MAG: hypothetical protein M0P14_02635 [Alkaliphilus sp.]|nr:hypothetical protein [Alkaliphilus sp.]
MDEQVILKLSTYDNLQMELIEAQDEVKRLRKTLDSIRVFELKESYGSKMELIYTDFALEQYGDLVDANPQYRFKELQKVAEWNIAEPKAVEEDA